MKKYFIKILTHVFRRTGKGSPYAGVKGGVRFSRNNFKKYEKNSKVKNYNSYEDVMPYSVFKEMEYNTQVELLIAWMNRYTNIKIYKDMGISENRFYSLVKRMNIDKRQSEPMRLSSDQMKKYKEKMISPDIFRSLQADVKFELAEHYQKEKGMTNAEIAESLGYALNTFTTQKSLWKKEYEVRKGDNMNADDFLIRTPKKDNVDVVAEEVKEYKPENSNDKTNKVFSVALSSTYSGDALKEIISALVLLLQDKTKYEIDISISAINKEEI